MIARGKCDRRTRIQTMIKIKRAYDPPSPDDGMRILVDRLWPRGVRKDALGIHRWIKDIAPSDELRKFFGHDPERWEEFRRRYREELKRGPARDALEELAKAAAKGIVTLVYGAKDEAHNDAVVLKEILEARLNRPRPRRARG